MNTKLWVLSLALGVLLLGCQSVAEQEMVSPQPPINPPGTPTEKSVKLIKDEFEGKEVILVGRAQLVTDSDVPSDLDAHLIWDFAAAFERELDGQLLDFSPHNNAFPIVMEDQEGNLWDWLGQAVTGPRKGQQLKNINSGLGFWLVFSAMYPKVEIHGTPLVNEQVPFENTENWGISTGSVARGAGFNAIPSINDPKFLLYEESAEKGESPAMDELIIGLEINGEVKAYPHFILDYHEIVNDVVGGVPVSLTYCPLTGTAKVYDLSQHPGDFFGVSGLLYNSNLMPFDASTSSIWHQLEGRCVNGARLGERIPLIPHIETSWGLWKNAYPETQILSTETGFDRRYGSYPYGDYKTNNDFMLATLDYDDDRLTRKERVFAIIVNGRAKVYTTSSFF